MLRSLTFSVSLDHVASFQFLNAARSYGITGFAVELTEALVGRLIMVLRAHLAGYMPG